MDCERSNDEEFDAQFKNSSSCLDIIVNEINIFLGIFYFL